MLLSVSGCVASHDDVANSRTQPLMSISGSTQLVGHRVRRSTIYVTRIQLRLFLENTLKKQPCHMMYRSSSTCTVCTRTALPCTALCHAPVHRQSAEHACTFSMLFPACRSTHHFMCSHVPCVGQTCIPFPHIPRLPGGTCASLRREGWCNSSLLALTLSALYLCILHLSKSCQHSRYHLRARSALYQLCYLEQALSFPRIPSNGYKVSVNSVIA